ncbi:hypothetical protein SeMB42_g06091 [Synchytrium endobioticum]|uniref:NOT2/NOT3/NOT5 C-terminal domain-containing protein n=1 Tax=Synchytrium endobioticum TaxID=286115 RepID=A0A507CRZ2_9FUNG|nr:hypothetical protein SeMB42_g06091 [Synchytrium endobioticum]TPX41927.1 hypothetical protein SeLEV6574_g05854 [Synchytrium endobioticum]
MAYNQQSARGPLFYSTQQQSTSIPTSSSTTRPPPPSLNSQSTSAFSTTGNDQNNVTMADFPALSSSLRDHPTANPPGMSFSSIAAANNNTPYYGSNSISRRDIIDVNGMDDFPALTPSSSGSTRSVNSTPTAVDMGYGLPVRRDGAPPGMITRGSAGANNSSNYYSSSTSSIRGGLPPPPSSLINNNNNNNNNSNANGLPSMNGGGGLSIINSNSSTLNSSTPVLNGNGSLGIKRPPFGLQQQQQQPPSITSDYSRFSSIGSLNNAVASIGNSSSGNSQITGPIGSHQVGSHQSSQIVISSSITSTPLTASTSITPSAPPNPTVAFGILGLLDVVRMTDRDLNMLALGQDVTSLGLSLSSSENLCSTFMSPFSDTPSLGAEPQFNLPNCYNLPQLPPPAISKIGSFSDETLFYVFYGLPREAAQEAAAQELYNRNWRYHKEFRLWLTKEPGSDVLQKGAGFERGIYVFFDPQQWARVKKECFLYYDQLEERGPVSGVAKAVIAGNAPGVIGSGGILSSSSVVGMPNSGNNIGNNHTVNNPALVGASLMNDAATASPNSFNGLVSSRVLDLGSSLKDSTFPQGFSSNANAATVGATTGSNFVGNISNSLWR